MVKVIVDFTYGVNGNFVRLKFNDNECFSADLNEKAPLAGPIATFTTYLPRGLNQCELFWQEETGGVHLPYNIECKDVMIGDANLYYMGISVSDDSTLVIDLREKPFLYCDSSMFNSYLHRFTIMNTSTNPSLFRTLRLETGRAAAHASACEESPGSAGRDAG